MSRRPVGAGDDAMQRHQGTITYSADVLTCTAYTRKVDVVFRGFAGYSSSHAKLIFDEILLAEHGSSASRVRLVVCIR
jgi:hypothetical protein